MVNVLLFAHLREQYGEESLQINGAGQSLKDLKKTLTEKYKLENLDQVMVAINEEFVNDDEVLREGDIVALIPPVSGG